MHKLPVHISKRSIMLRRERVAPSFNLHYVDQLTVAPFVPFYAIRPQMSPLWQIRVLTSCLLKLI